jgi:RNA binding exosome subunit
MFNFAKIEDLHTDLIGLHINLILLKKYYLQHNCDIRYILNKFKDTSKDELKDKLLSELDNKELLDMGLTYFFFLE